MEDIRIDKWLWAVRLFKTRNQASEACKKGRIIIDSIPVKASRIVKLNDVIAIYNPPVTRTYIVKGLLEKRQSASFVKDYLQEITPQEELDKLQTIKRPELTIFRPRGLGRPTKKDRRSMDRFRSDA